MSNRRTTWSREEERILTDLLQRMSHSSGVTMIDLINCANARNKMLLLGGIFFYLIQAYTINYLFHGHKGGCSLFIIWETRIPSK